MANVFRSGVGLKSWITAFLWLSGFLAMAQLEVVYPTTHLVIQRGTDNRATLFVAGMYTQSLDRIDARLVAVGNLGQSTDWQVVAAGPQNGVFQGSLLATGGLYRLEVRSMRQAQLIAQIAVEHVGIGEVFLVAGQSNAMGLPGLGAKGASERVVSINAVNYFLNSNNVIVAADQPFPAPVFTPLAADNHLFPMGETAWCWGELGDAIADRHRVPVAFLNVGFPGTVADNWSRSAHGQTAVNIFTSKPWPYGQPYANLRNTLQYVHSQVGIRAILWHHGESDAVPYHTPLADYYQLVQDVIDQSRLDTGHTISWVVARNSITPAGPTPSLAIIGAQNALIQTPGNNVWAGPDTDTIQSPRPAHGHFENSPSGKQGLSELARAWSQSLTDSFYALAKPLQPQRFLSIGLLPSQLPVGKEFVVPFGQIQIGFSEPTAVRVQLMNLAGSFVTEVGARLDRGTLRASLPDTLQTGLYRLRVVAFPAVLPSVPSGLFRVVSAGQPLNPLRDVQTERGGDSVRVYWQSAQELPGSRFVIEWQAGNNPFRSVGAVSALNDGQPYHVYTFTYAPAPTEPGTYRIRLESPDGAVLYNIGALVTAVEELRALPFVYPNPATGTTLMLRLPERGAWLFRVIDAAGRSVDQQMVSAPADGVVAVPLPAILPDGVYLIQLSLRDRVYTQRLLIGR